MEEELLTFPTLRPLRDLPSPSVNEWGYRIASSKNRVGRCQRNLVFVVKFVLASRENIEIQERWLRAIIVGIADRPWTSRR
jgi:hypothetical protein